MIRLFKIAKDSATKARTQTINQLRAVLARAEPALREALAGLGSVRRALRRQPHRSIFWQDQPPPARGGDRRANSALYTIVLTRMGRDQRTRDYAERRTTEDKSKKDITRCLKRYVAREVFPIITQALSSAATTTTTT